MKRVLYIVVLVSVMSRVDVGSLYGAGISIRFGEQHGFLNAALAMLGLAEEELPNQPQRLQGFRLSPIVASRRGAGRTRRFERATDGSIRVAVDKGVQPDHIAKAAMTRGQALTGGLVEVELRLTLTDDGAVELQRITKDALARSDEALRAVAVLVGESLFLVLKVREAIVGQSLVLTSNVSPRTILCLERSLGIKAKRASYSSRVRLASLVEQLANASDDEEACLYLQIVWLALARARHATKRPVAEGQAGARLAFQKGVIAAMSLDFDQAEPLFRQACLCDVHRPIAQSYLADIERLRGRYSEARRLYSKALENIPREQTKRYGYLRKHIDRGLAKLEGLDR